MIFVLGECRRNYKAAARLYHERSRSAESDAFFAIVFLVCTARITCQI